MRNLEPRKDYSTGDAAKICGCSQQTIIRCFDKGLIKSHHIPGSRFRKIPIKNLYEYMKQNNIPLDNFPKEHIPKGLDYVMKINF